MNDSKKGDAQRANKRSFNTFILSVPQQCNRSFSALLNFILSLKTLLRNKPDDEVSSILMRRRTTTHRLYCQAVVMSQEELNLSEERKQGRNKQVVELTMMDLEPVELESLDLEPVEVVLGLVEVELELVELEPMELEPTELKQEGVWRTLLSSSTCATGNTAKILAKSLCLHQRRKGMTSKLVNK